MGNKRNADYLTGQGLQPDYGCKVTQNISEAVPGVWATYFRIPADICLINLWSLVQKLPKHPDDQKTEVAHLISNQH
jgi:hypothetical protein